jgi:myo-inositol catabolism protein IolH
VLRGLNSSAVGFVYVASHTFHYGDRATTLLPELGDRIGAVYTADTYDHHRSHGLRYITNPPGNAVRVHQHLRIGDGDVDWTELFSTLREVGYLDRDDALIVSNVFAEDEARDEVSRYQLEKLRELIG